MPSGLEVLIEEKVLAILKTLLKDKEKIHHLNSLAAESKVSVSSTFRILKKLIKNGFVDELKIGKWSVYKLADNKKVKELRQLL